MANIKTKNRRRKIRQQEKHMNQILGLILGEKNNRKLTLRHKRRKEYQPSSNRNLEEKKLLFQKKICCLSYKELYSAKKLQRNLHNNLKETQQ
jgi:hypothetical protein